jgi:hypothetical protein
VQKFFLPQAMDKLHCLSVWKLSCKANQSPVRLIVTRFTFDQLRQPARFAKRKVYFRSVFGTNVQK